MFLVRSSWDNPVYRFRCPFTMCRILRFSDPRATPAARFGLGVAFLRAVRFAFFRSTGSVIVFVFILVFSILRIFPPASSGRSQEN